jgi:dipeptidyl aminopeptidase/acylaminoacyl peptidase
MVIAWTPDGRSILFQSSTPTGEIGTFWLISADGGQPRKVGLNLRPTVAPLRFNPKTNQIAVTAKMPRREVWVMEHFLPAPKAPSTPRQDR